MLAPVNIYVGWALCPAALILGNKMNKELKWIIANAVTDIMPSEAYEE